MKLVNCNGHRVSVWPHSTFPYDSSKKQFIHSVRHHLNKVRLQLINLQLEWMSLTASDRVEMKKRTSTIGDDVEPAECVNAAITNSGSVKENLDEFNE